MNFFQAPAIYYNAAVGTVANFGSTLKGIWRILTARDTIADIDYGNGNIVAVGSGGLVMVSPNTPLSPSWEIVADHPGVALTTTHSFTVVKYLNGKWYALGRDVTSGGVIGLKGCVMTSVDGIDWTAVPSDSGVFDTAASLTFRAIAWNGSVYVITAGVTGSASSYLWTSTDGITWTQRTNLTQQVMDIAVVGTRFIAAVAGYYTGYSDNGITWTFTANALLSGNAAIPGKIATNGIITVLMCTKLYILTSSDSGGTWTARTATGGSATKANECIWSGFRFYVSSETTTYTSTDGITWVNPLYTVHTLLTSDDVGNIWGSRGTVVNPMVDDVVVGGPVSNVAISPLGTFDSTGPATTTPVMYTLSDGGLYIGNASNARTTDGVNWTVPSAGFWGVYGRTAYTTNSGYVVIPYTTTAVATLNTLYTSATGTSTVVARTTGITTPFYVISNGVNMFVYCGSNGSTTYYVKSSPDGITWTLRLSVQINAAVYGNGKFVLVSGTTVYTSTDGITWTTTTGQTFANTGATAMSLWNGTVYVSASTSAAVLATSPDGVTWTRRTTGSAVLFTGLASDGVTTIIATTGVSNLYYISTDNGATWSTGTIPSTYPATTVGYINGLFYIMTKGGRAFTSPNGTVWTRFAVARANTANWLTIDQLTGAYYTGDGMGGRVKSNNRGVAWEPDVAPLAETNNTKLSSDIITHGSLQVAFLASTGSVIVQTSTDGITWTQRLNAVVSNSIVVGGGAGLASNGTVAILTAGGATGSVAGGVWSSTDGITWTKSTAMLLQCGRPVWANNRFIVPTSTGMWYSLTGTSGWTQCPATVYGAGGNARSAIYADGAWYVTGAGAIYRSTDFVNWTTYTLPGQVWALNAITHQPGVGFFAAGVGGASAFSADGVTWTTAPVLASVETIYDVKWDPFANQFVAFGVSSSTGGAVWYLPPPI